MNRWTALRLQYSHTKFRHFWIQTRCAQRCDERVARVERVDDGIDPQASGAIARVHLLVVVFLVSSKSFLRSASVSFCPPRSNCLILISTSVPAADSPLITE